MSDASHEYRRHLDPRTLARMNGLDLRARAIVEGVMAGMHRSPFQGISVEFAQHRPYVQGDDVRHIDWKQMGKTDKLYLKQYQQETNLQLLCVVDASESMEYGTVPTDQGTWTKYDHATSIAAALAHLTIRQQDSVGLAIFDQTLNRFFKPSNTPGQWRLIINELQQVPRWHKTQTGKVLAQLAEKLTHRSLIVVLSDLFDDLDSIRSGLQRLRYRKHELMVLQVLDPTELEFPFDDVTLFKGLEEAGELLTEPRALRAAYLQQVQLFTEEMKKLCRGMGVDFEQFNTSRPLDVSLSNYLATRMASITS